MSKIPIIDHIRLANFRLEMIDWLNTLFGYATASVSNTVGTPAVSVNVNANGGLNFNFSNLKGETGANAYLFLRFAATGNPADADMHSSPQTGDKFVGFATSTVNTAPTSASAYTWGKFVGEDGTGIEIKANAAACTELGNAYIDQTTGHIMILTALPDTFTDGGLIKGADGNDGLSSYLYLAYASSATPAQADIHTDYPHAGDKYIGVKLDITSGGSSRPATYDGYDFWTKFVGEDGADGSVWFTVNTNLPPFSQASNVVAAVPTGSTWKAGDYLLNAYNGYIYKCTYLAMGISNWTYEGCIKGATGANGTSAYWFTGTAVTGSGTNISASVSGSKAGDMYLNTSNYHVYKATAANTWDYECNIKGGSGTSAYWFSGTAVTGTGTNISASVANSKAGDMYLNTSSYNVYIATAANLWDYKCNIKGATGADGQDGSVVSKAYRFVGDAQKACTLKCGSITQKLFLQKGDARITINSAGKYADVHLTLYCMSPSAPSHDVINWYVMMYEIRAYQGGSSVVGMVDGNIDKVELPDTTKDDGAFYGVVNIRHDRDWPGGDTTESARPIVIDLHGVLPDSTDFGALFFDGVAFDLELT